MAIGCTDPSGMSPMILLARWREKSALSTMGLLIFTENGIKVGPYTEGIFP